jgi:hypothetical protein
MNSRITVPSKVCAPGVSLKNAIALSDWLGSKNVRKEGALIFQFKEDLIC